MITGEVVAFVLFLASGIGIYFLLKKKIRALAEFPKDDGKNTRYYIDRARARVQRGRLQEDLFSLNVLTQKLLSKIQVIALRTEAKTGKWLERLRKQTKNQQEKFSESYWAQIKKKKKEGDKE